MTRARRRGLLCSLPFLGLALPSVARAEVPQTAELVYDVAPVADACPDEVRFRLAVTQRLGRDPFVLGDRRKIAVTFARTPSGYAAEVRTLDGVEERGRRRIEADEGCAEVASGAALAVSIAIDPLVLLRSEPPPKPPAAEPRPSPRGAPAPRPKPAPARVSKPTEPTWQASVGGHGWAGAVPKPSFGASLGLRLRSGAWSLGVGAFAVLPREERREGTPLAVSAELYSGALTLCGHAGVLRLCALGEFGVLVAHGHGVDRPRSDRTAHVASGATAGLVLRHGRFSVAPVVGAAARLRKTSLILDGTQVWKAPTLFGSLGVELDISW